MSQRPGIPALLEYGHHVVFSKDEEFLAFHFDFRTTVLPKEDLVPYLDADRPDLTAVE